MATQSQLYCLLVLLVGAAIAEHVIVEQEDVTRALPHHWSKASVYTSMNKRGDKKLTLTFALKQRNLDALEQKFWSVSDLKSSDYANYLTFEQVTELVAPSSQDVSTVVNWLTDNGAQDVKVHDSRDFITASMSVATAEQLLQTTYHYFHHAPSGRHVLKAVGSYSLPSHIASKVAFVSGFRLPNIKVKKPVAHSKTMYEFQASQLENVKSLVSGTGPVLLYINPLDQIAGLTFLPLCNNGDVTTTVPKLCSDVGGNSVITSFDVLVNQSGVVTDRSFTVAQANCKPCDQASGHVASSCTQFNALQNYPNNTVYCEVMVNQLTNYLPTSFSLRSTFVSGQNSDLGTNDFSVHTGKFVTPYEIFNLYKIPTGLIATNPASSQSVAEFLGQYYSPSDLSLFFQWMGLPDQSQLVQVIGPNDVTNPGGEASLDIQYLMGVAGNTRTVFWSLGQLHDGQEPFLDWITDVLNTKQAPYVHSISYGDDEDSLTTDYMNRCNAEFMKAGVRGISLMFSSGDNGVYGGASFSCPHFFPSFPAGSPYVTSVGATLFSTQTIPICEQNFYGLPLPCHIVGETTSSTKLGSRVSSGGGFSNVFPQPSYQAGVVNNYIHNSISNIPSSFYNSSGRAYPDVATLGHNYLVIINGQIVPVDGTSAAAPVFAGVITLLNDIRLNNNEQPLGFLNPLIYQAATYNATSFNDIKTGDNACSELPWICCDYGLPAATGWDAVTGFGSPNFDVLSKFVGNLSSKKH